MKKVARRYPPLPKSVAGSGGDLDIVMVDKLTVDAGEDHDVLGVFRATDRRIEILKTLRRDQQWLVLYHELAHAALWDSGAANALAGAQEEIICDAIATARLRERFG